MPVPNNKDIVVDKSRQKMMAKIHVLWSEWGLSVDKAKELIYYAYQIESMAELTNDQVIDVLNAMHTKKGFLEWISDKALKNRTSFTG